MDRRGAHHGGNVRPRAWPCSLFRGRLSGHIESDSRYLPELCSLDSPEPNFPRPKNKEEAANRLPPFGLASSSSRTTGQVAICLLGINGGFSRGGNILSSSRLQNFLRTLDFLGRVAMHREQNFALLQATFVSLGFEFRNTHANQGASDSTNGSSNAQPR